MGKQSTCTLEYRDQSHNGKAYLETDYLLFRGDIRLKVLFEQIKGASARDGRLQLNLESETLSLALGEVADNWADRILHPPSLLSKLGIGAGSRVAFAGKINAAFREDLKAAGALLVKLDSANAIFLAVQAAADLKEIPALTSKASLWIVYPKGVTTVREADVISAGRAAGLKDTKVVAFSKTHTALRFSQPLMGSQRIKKTTA